MLTLRQRIFLIISIVVGLIIAIVLGIVYLKRQSEESGPRTVTDTTEPSTPTTPATTLRPEVEVPRVQTNPEELYLRQLATIFVERFATFSNQNNNRHIDDALSLSTPKMQTWLKTQRLAPGEAYNGVTTQVMSTSLASKATDKATVRVAVQQDIGKKSSPTSSLESQLAQKKGTVELVKIGADWKVDGFFWDK